MIRRVNITIDEHLHEKAKAHAKDVHFTDFSGMITKLIVDDLRAEAILQAKGYSQPREVEHLAVADSLAPAKTVAVPGGQEIKAGASAKDKKPLKYPTAARRKAG